MYSYVDLRIKGLLRLCWSVLSHITSPSDRSSRSSLSLLIFFSFFSFFLSLSLSSISFLLHTSSKNGDAPSVMLRKYLPSVPPLLFALVVVSVLSSKSLHLLQHVQSLPLLYFVLYSPTLILWDLFVIAVSRVLLVSPETRLRWVLFLFGGFVAYVSLFLIPRAQMLMV